MKKTLKGYAAGFLTAAILTGGLAYAYGAVRIVVDNKELIPTDVNGNRVDPIVVDGTTYLPVRAVANALGVPVYWDGPNYTVYLGDMNGTLEYPTVELEDMTSIADDIAITDRLTDNYGNAYEHAIHNHYRRIKYEYLLNMKYSRFKGILYIPKDEKDDESVYLSIIADGKTIYTSPEMTKVSRPIEIDVDIRGCNNLKIEYSKGLNSGYHGLSVCLGNAGFYQ